MSAISTSKRDQQMTPEEATRKGENFLECIPEKLRRSYKKAVLCKELNLTRRNVDVEHVTKFIIPFLNLSPGIVGLNVSSNRIGNEGAIALAGNTTLTSLNVGANQIRVSGTIALVWDTKLTTLNVGDNELGDDGVIALVQAISLRNRTLTSLNVGNNGIGDKSAIALAGNTNLTVLNVPNNEIGDKGAIALARNTNLTALDVRNNRIEMPGAIALAAKTNLTMLSIRNNSIGEEGRQILREVSFRRRNEYLFSTRAFLMGCDPHLGKDSAILLLYSKDGEHHLKRRIFGFLRPLPFKVDA